MNIEENETIFVLDTNILIESAYWYPFEFFPEFWQVMEKLLKEGRWILLDVVEQEIGGPKKLKKWINTQKVNGLVNKITDEVRSLAAEINDQYQIIDGIKSQADAYIIAFSKINGCTLFTREGHRKMPSDIYKIPDVCDILAIKYIRYVKDFIRSVGFEIKFLDPNIKLEPIKIV
ncbi:MAG: DUF4411 family protein [Candidatus Buchananbacteria bacterium]